VSDVSRHPANSSGPDADMRRAVRWGLMAAVALMAVGWAGHRAVHATPEADANNDPPSVAHWRVPLDRADAADLELLPGVGPTLARRMWEVCGRPAPTRASDLTRVPRLGPTGRKRIAPWVTFGAASVSATQSEASEGFATGRIKTIAVSAVR